MTLAIEVRLPLMHTAPRPLWQPPVIRGQGQSMGGVNGIIIFISHEDCPAIDVIIGYDFVARRHQVY